MNATSRFCTLGSAILAVAAGAYALGTTANPGNALSQDTQPPGEQPMDLPDGWTMEDMMVFVEAGTPGPMHQWLAEGAGRWSAETTMWMTPDADPITSKGNSVTTPMMGGRFVKVEMSGEMPGMGPYNGFGLYGYNNATKQFESIWIDNHSTGIMRGTGKLSDDKKTLRWEYNYYCPLREEMCKLREVERIIGPNTRTLEMHGSDAKTGEEFKMMEIKLTRAAASR